MTLKHAITKRISFIWWDFWIRKKSYFHWDSDWYLANDWRKYEMAPKMMHSSKYIEALPFLLARAGLKDFINSIDQIVPANSVYAWVYWFGFADYIVMCMYGHNYSCQMEMARLANGWVYTKKYCEFYPHISGKWVLNEHLRYMCLPRNKKQIWFLWKNFSLVQLTFYSHSHSWLYSLNLPFINILRSYLVIFIP